MPARPAAAAADDAVVQAVAQAITQAQRAGGKAALLLGGQALREPGLLAAARIAAHAGVKLLAEVFPTRLTRAPACRPSSASPAARAARSLRPRCARRSAICCPRARS